MREGVEGQHQPTGRNATIGTTTPRLRGRDLEDSAKQAPWTVVPADAKWYRNLVIAESIVEALSRHRKVWQRKLDQMGKAARAEPEACGKSGSTGEKA
jgi:hypothetical protein